MNNKHNLQGGLALLFFIFLAAWVLVNPASLTALDTSLQSVVRGDLPDLATAFFSRITLLFNTSIVVTWVTVLFFIFLHKRRKRMAFFLAGNLATSGLVIVMLKAIFRRPRPDILHLVEEHGFSFPSGHSLASTLVCGSLIILAVLFMKEGLGKWLVSLGLGLMIAIILLSRVYLGVHYPSDVLAGFLLGFALLSFQYPKVKNWLLEDKA